MSEKLNSITGLSQNTRFWDVSLLPTLAGEKIIDPEEEIKKEKELKSMQAVKFALKNYRKCSYVHINECENYIKNLPERQQNMLSTYRQRLSNIRDCIDKNQDVINQILRISDEMYTKVPDLNIGIKLGPEEVDKAQSFLKLIARDWSDACAEEREQSYKPIIDTIEEFFPPNLCHAKEIKILVPGAGLGRLTYELASRGYDCEGNEFSFFMLMSSYFILNYCKIPRAFSAYPWIHQYVNNLNGCDQTACIEFPDVCPAQTEIKGKISMMAGDFLETYNEADKYDCVATCFFIDCANNIIDFIETIYKILTPGGIWVNLGPLLYNYCEIKGENSIEPTYDELIPIVKQIGFEILRTQTGVRTRYAQNPKSMLKSEYESVFWVCRKPEQTFKEHKNGYEICYSENGENNYKQENKLQYNSYNSYKQF